MSNQLPPPGSEPAWRGGRDMHETDPDIINSQIEASRAEVPLATFLNNFALNLPGGGHRTQFQDDDWALDRPFVTTVSDYKRAAMSETTQNPEFTRRKYFKAIDDAIEAESEVNPDFDSEGLEDRRQSWQTASETVAPDANEKLEAYLEYSLPVYRRLRTMGYSHYDLWG